MTNIKTPPKIIKPKYGQILTTYSFKHLGEGIEQNVSQKDAVKFTENKMNIAYYLTKDIHSKKNISINVKQLMQQ